MPRGSGGGRVEIASGGEVERRGRERWEGERRGEVGN